MPEVARPLADDIHLASIAPLVEWGVPVFSAGQRLEVVLPVLRTPPGIAVVLLEGDSAAVVGGADALACLAGGAGASAPLRSAVRQVPLMNLASESHVNSALYRCSSDRLLFAPVKGPSGEFGIVSAVALLRWLEQQNPGDPFFQQPLSVVGLADVTAVPAGAGLSDAVRALRESSADLAILVDQRGRYAAALTPARALLLLLDGEAALGPLELGALEPPAPTLAPASVVSTALESFFRTGAPSLAVLEDDRPRGVLRALDLVIAYAEAHPEQTLNLSPDPEQLIPKEVGSGGE